MALPLIKNTQYIRVGGGGKNLVLMVYLPGNQLVIVKSDRSAIIVNADGEHLTGTIPEVSNVVDMLEYHSALFSQVCAEPFEIERMSPAELKELEDFDPTRVAGLKKPWKETVRELTLKTATPISLGLVTEKEKRTPDPVTYTPYKIQWKAGLADAGKIQEDLFKMVHLYAALRKGNTDTMKQLGAILAVDWFIGNGDRFEFDFNGKRFSFVHGNVKNATNIFLLYDQKLGRFKDAIGLDTFDDLSPWANLNRTIEEIEGGSPHSRRWPGRCLAHGERAERDSIARNAVNGIIRAITNQYTNPEKPHPKSGEKQRVAIPLLPIEDAIKDKLVRAFHEGISEGKRKLRSKYACRTLVKGSPLAKGIESRLKIIQGTNPF
jgi:hypothetical protein